MVKLACAALAAWLAGFLVSTRILYPAAPPPTGFFGVPDVVGLELASAGTLLAGVGLTIGRVDSLSHPVVPAGEIFGQSPLPGQVAGNGDSLRLTVSSGALTRLVPDVAGLSGASAEVLIVGTGFAIARDTVTSDLRRGSVVETVPEAGTVLSLPDTVRMVVSSGPPPFTMPSMVGMRLEAAEALADSLQLVIADVREIFRFGFDGGLVVEQEPEAGVEVRKGGEVRLAVGWSRRERVRSP